MDPRLLEYYNRELQFMREMGAEFARAYPRVAARLGIDGLECADPYVERLLEGFAFLAARVQLKLDARHPGLHAAPAGDGVSALSWRQCRRPPSRSSCRISRKDRSRKGC